MSTFSRIFFAGLLFTAPLAISCSSCESCGTAETTAPSDQLDAAEVQKPDVVKDTRGEMLEKATKNAEILGDQTAFDRTTKARFMAAELEGMDTEVVEAPKVKGPSKPKYDDKGQLDVAKLKQVFRTNQSALRKCYERALKTDPAMQGKVTMTIRIGGGGKASLVKARSQQIANRTALECMERSAKGWTYPAPTGGTVLVNKAFSFTPQN